MSVFPEDGSWEASFKPWQGVAPADGGSSGVIEGKNSMAKKAISPSAARFGFWDFN
jgi:hypothetical protein